MFFEAVELDGEHVGAGQLIEEIEDAFLIGSGGGGGVGFGLFDSDFRAGDKGALLVGYASREAAVGVLGQRGSRRSRRTRGCIEAWYRRGRAV